MSRPPVVALDDDPTGAQAQAGVPVLLEWTPELLAEAALAAPPAIHLLTNTRAVPAAAAEATTFAAARAAAESFPGSPVVLRGDSTLRAHLVPEYEGLRRALRADSPPPLMLVPALPAAGRITEGGIHYLVRAGARVPVGETEYATDPDFAFRSSRLLDWAEERSAGLFAASAGREVGAGELRASGGAAVASALADLAAADAPAALVVDATDEADLALAANGMRAAEAAGTPVIVRSAPAFVGVLAGSTAHDFSPLPSATGPVLVVCGSHVPATTRQLERLAAREPDDLVWARTERLAGPEPEAEIAAVVGRAATRLEAGRTAVVATTREVLGGTGRLELGAKVATGLAAVLARLRDRAGVVISKGGITSAINLREGMASAIAQVVGPLRPGVSLWSVDTPERRGVPFVVFPGNVGGDADLADLVAAIGAGS